MKNRVLVDEKGEIRAENYQVVGVSCTHPNGRIYELHRDKPIKKVTEQFILGILQPYLREEMTHKELVPSDKKDTSRSGLEFRKCVALLRLGKTRERIYKTMQAYSKWSTAPEQYKTATFEKAENFVLQEKEKEKDGEAPEAGEEDINFLKNKNILEEIDKEIDKKVVGEHNSRKSIFVIANMRNVENLNKSTDNVMVHAVSGVGKDCVTEAVFDLIPDKEKEELIRTTPKVLVYTRNKKIEENATWKKVALRLEDAGNEVLNDDAFKVMSSANPNKINRMKIVNRGKIIEGEIEGKPPIIMTIAFANPKEELLRRYPILGLDEGINQTKEILRRQAQFAKKGKSIEYNDKVTKALACLKRVKVKVPFAERLVSIFCPDNVIVRTHFPRFIDYIKSSCSLHQYQRQADEAGFFIAEEQDYNIAKMVLEKTTSNILMIPLTKDHRTILDVFENENIQNASVADLEDYDEIKKINITQEWLRKKLDWLASKTFLTKGKEKRYDEAGKVIPKPVFVYSYNKMQVLDIPEWNKLTELTSNTSNTDNTSDTSITSLTTPKTKDYTQKRVNEVKRRARNITLFDNTKPKVETIKIAEVTT